MGTNALGNNAGRRYLGLGALVFDVVMRLPAYPLVDSKNRAAGPPLLQTGGPVPRALMIISRFGGQGELISVTGEDIAGDTVGAELADWGIGAERLYRNSASSTNQSCIWLAADTGSRTIAYAFDETPPPLPDAGTLLEENRYAAVLLDGRFSDVAVPLAAAARDRGIPVAIDLGGGSKPRLRELSQLATIIIGTDLSWPQLADQPGMGIPEVMRQFPGATRIHTRPDHSMLAMTDEVEFEARSPEVVAVDSNGAGDVFFGALVWALTTQSDLPWAVDFAASAARLKCLALGNPNLPHFDAVTTETWRVRGLR